MKFESDFDIGDCVNIDADKSISACITQVRWTGVLYYEVCWFSNGDAKSAVIESWRLKQV